MANNNTHSIADKYYKIELNTPVHISRVFAVCRMFINIMFITSYMWPNAAKTYA